MSLYALGRSTMTRMQHTEHYQYHKKWQSKEEAGGAKSAAVPVNSLDNMDIDLLEDRAIEAKIIDMQNFEQLQCDMHYKIGAASEKNYSSRPVGS